MIYNQIGKIDGGSIANLQMLTSIAKQIRGKDQQFVFPDLLWLLRDIEDPEFEAEAHLDEALKDDEEAPDTF